VLSFWYWVTYILEALLINIVTHKDEIRVILFFHLALLKDLGSFVSCTNDRSLASAHSPTFSLFKSVSRYPQLQLCLLKIPIIIFTYYRNSLGIQKQNLYLVVCILNNRAAFNCYCNYFSISFIAMFCLFMINLCIDKIWLPYFLLGIPSINVIPGVSGNDLALSRCVSCTQILSQSFSTHRVARSSPLHVEKL